MEAKRRNLIIYRTQEGRRPFTEWLRDLKDVKTRAIINARVNRVELGNFGDVKTVGDGVSELRIQYGPGYRVYFGQDGIEIVVLLCGGDKGSQMEDIRRAKELWSNFKKEKQNAY